jgi:Outer membrane lipoprotein-sorting protein
VRLWVDQKEKLVMQAAVIDANGEEQRTIEVKDLQKIKGTELWMLKDMEIRNRRTGSRARLTVDEVR